MDPGHGHCTLSQWGVIAWPLCGGGLTITRYIIHGFLSSSDQWDPKCTLPVTGGGFVCMCVVLVG